MACKVKKNFDTGQHRSNTIEVIRSEHETTPFQHNGRCSKKGQKFQIKNMAKHTLTNHKKHTDAKIEANLYCFMSVLK